MSIELLPGPRPQPLGALPWPAGMLLLPEGTDDLAAALVSGREPESWPVGSEFVRRALDEDIEQAVADLPGDDLLSRYNRAVLVGGDGVWEALAAETSGELRALVDTARFSVGLVDEPPSADGATGEVAAVVRSARASAAIENGDIPAAVAELGGRCSGRRRGRQPPAGRVAAPDARRAAARAARRPGGCRARGRPRRPAAAAQRARRSCAPSCRSAARWLGSSSRAPSAAPCSPWWPTSRRRSRCSARTPTRRCSPPSTSISPSRTSSCR